MHTIKKFDGILNLNKSRVIFFYIRNKLLK